MKNNFTLKYSLTFYEDFRNKWYLVYPELDNEKIFLNRTIPLNLKLNYYSVKTRTFFIAKKIQILINHLLNNNWVFRNKNLT